AGLRARVKVGAGGGGGRKGGAMGAGWSPRGPVNWRRRGGGRRPRATSPFASAVPPEHARHAVWVEPVLVIEVTFTGWTQAGRIRAASYQGLRADKDPAEVIREP
ncbi:MAG: non-homologous end-joining DNA ligase, partial [Streptosporangiaceae bacterium]